MSVGNETHPACIVLLQKLRKLNRNKAIILVEENGHILFVEGRVVLLKEKSCLV